MSKRDHTFIDAYGLELSDELQADYAEPTRNPVGAAHQPSPTENVPPSVRSYRFDSAARRTTLRGPHFDMRRVAAHATGEISGWDALDMNVIDVGAAWSASPIASPVDEQPLAAPRSREVEPTPVAVEVAEFDETTETIEVVAEVAAPAAVTSAAVAEKAVAKKVAPEEVAPEEVAPEEVAPEEVAAVDAQGPPSQAPIAAKTEAPVATNSSPSIDSAEPFAPVWEVDRFHWPEDIEQLFTAQTEYFDYAGKKLVAASREGLSILAIISTRSGEGSTTLALCLARAAAGAGARVALLDGNLQRSELGDKLGVDFASGWQSAAACEQPLAEAAITGLEEGITLFPSAAAPVAEIESLGDQRVGQVLRTAAANYDLLIIDAGQADLGSNVEALDAAIVVRDIRYTSESETLNVAAALRNRGVKAVGIAENFGNSQAVRAAA